MREKFSAVGREIDQTKLESLGVLVRYGMEVLPSNGGLILFGKPDARCRYFPDAQVRCARFKGTSKSSFLDQLDIEGTVLDAVFEVPKFIRRNTRMAGKIEGIQREDIPEYPAVSLREGLANAVAHTDYSQHGMQIMVAIYDDRLEIQNPGILPHGMTIEDLKAGVSRIRNPVIARVLRELELMEKWGSGFRRIVEDCDSRGYPYPEWTELGSSVRIAFPPHPEVSASSVEAENGKGADVPGDVPINVPINVPGNVPGNVPINERQEWFLARIQAGEMLRPRDMAERFGVSLKTAKRDVSALQKNGVIEYVGPKKSGRYRLKMELLGDGDGGRE